MVCDWLKIYDEPEGGNLLNPNDLYMGQTIYIDISEIPSEYEFVAWKDLNGNLLDDTVIRIVESGRYETSDACIGGFVAYVRAKVEDVCIVAVDCDETKGVVFCSGDYNHCNEQVQITAIPNCCYKFDTWSDSGLDNRLSNRDVTVTTGVNTYTANFINETFPIIVDVNDSTLGRATVSKNNVSCGESFTCVAYPEPNCVFDYWSPINSIDPQITIVYNCGDLQKYVAHFSELPTYSLTYVGNCPNIQLPDVINYFRDDETVVYRTISNSNYDFLGWAFTDDATQPDINPGQTGTYTYGMDKTIYGVWKEKKVYTISYYGWPEDPSHQYDPRSEGYAGARITLYTPDNTFPNYYFLGWRITQVGVPLDPNSDIITGTYTIINEDMEAYAVWSMSDVNCRLTYIYNDGTNDATTINGIPAGASIIIKSPSQLGISYQYHTFTEWIGNGTTYTAGNVIYFPNYDVYLSAGWVENIVTVTYDVTDSDNGSRTPQVQTAHSGQEVILDDGNGIFKNGYIFNGWSQINGSNTPLNSPITVTTAIVLYPVWKIEKRYTVRYISSGCNSVIDPTRYLEGETVTVLDCSCSSESGCTCLGWVDTEGIIYQGGDTFQIQENMIMSEYWDCCEVRFFTNNIHGNVYIDNSLIHWGDKVNIDYDIDFNVVTPEGFCFEGLIDMANGRYIVPCNGQTYSYKIIPSVFANHIDNNLVILMNDNDFISEIRNKTEQYTSSLLIMNIDTGEIRQAVPDCEIEEYDIGSLCNGNIYVVICCGSYEESLQGEHQYVEEHSGDFDSLYDYIELYGGEVPSSEYVLIKIKGVERYFTYTPCPIDIER